MINFFDSVILLLVIMWYVMISLFLWMNLYMLISEIDCVLRFVFFFSLWVMFFFGVLLCLRKLVMSVNMFFGYSVLCVRNICL